MTIRNYKELSGLFTPPEKTPARIPFGNPPNPVYFKDAKVIVYGVPFDGKRNKDGSLGGFILKGL